MRPFGTMSVLENVAVAAHGRAVPGAATLTGARRTSSSGSGSSPLARRAAATSLPTAGLKRLELARALATRPRVLLLDEVLAGLVPAERAPVMELLDDAAQRGRRHPRVRRAHHGRGDAAVRHGARARPGPGADHRLAAGGHVATPG